MKYRERTWWKKCKERIVSLFTARMKEDEREKKRQTEKRTSQSETSNGEVWKMALSLSVFVAELSVCQCCSGRTAEKDGDDGKDAAAGSSGEREQMGGGNSTKVEAAKRRRQDRNDQKRLNY